MSERIDNAAESCELLREALTLAARAFAQYALDTNDPTDEAVETFVDGFIQDACLRGVRT